MPSVGSVTLEQISERVKTLTNIIGTEEIERALFSAALFGQMSVQEYCKIAVYATPPSKFYRRTWFLHAAMYSATLHENNYADARTRSANIGYGPTGPKKTSTPSKNPDLYSGQYVMTPFRHSGSATKAIVVAAAPYAEDVEYGNDPNANYGPRPFVRPGMEIALPGMERMLTEQVSRINSRIARGRRRDASTGRFLPNVP